MSHAAFSKSSATTRTTGVAAEDRQRALAAYNRTRLLPQFANERWQETLEADLAAQVLEGQFVEAERAMVRERAEQAPTDPEGFLRWFDDLKHTGPGQHDPLFPWLRDSASRREMCWFLRQEMAGEAGFDDLVAMSQVRMAYGPKLELARNYWDEMGQGHEGGMHSPLLTRLAEELAITGPEDNADIVVPSLALGNLMVALACNRRYTYQSIGALGVIELTAPGRAEMVNAGLKRIGVDGAARRYFALHATLDKKHSEAWNREVIGPLVAVDARTAQALAEGALMRLHAGARCFDRYRSELGRFPRVVR